MHALLLRLLYLHRVAASDVITFEQAYDLSSAALHLTLQSSLQTLANMHPCQQGETTLDDVLCSACFAASVNVATVSKDSTAQHSSPEAAIHIGASAIAAQVLVCSAGANNLDDASHTCILAGYGQVKDCEVQLVGGPHRLGGVDCTQADALLCKLIACIQKNVGLGG